MKLDPLKTAKIIGWLLLILSALSLISTLLSLGDTTKGGTVIVELISDVLGVAAGYGLVKTKQWGIYLFGANLLFNFLKAIGPLTSKFTNVLEKTNKYAAVAGDSANKTLLAAPLLLLLLLVVVIGLQLLFFFLFYNNRAKFSK